MEFDSSIPQPPPMAPQPPLLPQAPPALPPGMMMPAPAYPLSSQDDRTMGMLCHLLSIFTPFFGPLILWLVKKDESPFLDHHGREALNFQITKLLYIIAGFALVFVFIGIVVLPAVMIFALVVEVTAAVAASRGEWYRYPLCIRFL